MYLILRKTWKINKKFFSTPHSALSRAIFNLCKFKIQLRYPKEKDPKRLGQSLNREVAFPREEISSKQLTLDPPIRLPSLCTLYNLALTDTDSNQAELYFFVIREKGQKSTFLKANPTSGQANIAKNCLKWAYFKH